MVPVRRRPVVLVDELGVCLQDVVARRCDERLLVHAASDTLAPPAERVAERGEVLRHIVENAEVDQREPSGCTALDLGDRLLPRFEIELRGGQGAKTNRPEAMRTPAASPA